MCESFFELNDQYWYMYMVIPTGPDGPVGIDMYLVLTDQVHIKAQPFLRFFNSFKFALAK